MNLLAGYRFGVAPGFHLPMNWHERLRINGGSEILEHGVFPRQNWRSLTDHELQLILLPEHPDQPFEKHDDALRLVRLPDHLLARWWQILEQADLLAGGLLPGFDEFTREVSKFLTFKGLLTQERVHFELMLSKPGQSFIHWDGNLNQGTGLEFNISPGTELGEDSILAAPKLLGGFNLGEEPTEIAVVNLTPRQILDGLSFQAQDCPQSHGELGRRFLKARPDYPLLLIPLEAGEGFWLPSQGIILDGYSVGKEEPDLALLLWDQGHG